MVTNGYNWLRPNGRLEKIMTEIYEKNDLSTDTTVTLSALGVRVLLEPFQPNATEIPDSQQLQTPIRNRDSTDNAKPN